MVHWHNERHNGIPPGILCSKQAIRSQLYIYRESHGFPELYPICIRSSCLILILIFPIWPSISDKARFKTGRLLNVVADKGNSTTASGKIIGSGRLRPWNMGVSFWTLAEFCLDRSGEVRSTAVAVRRGNGVCARLPELFRAIVLPLGSLEVDEPEGSASEVPEALVPAANPYRAGISYKQHRTAQGEVRTLTARPRLRE